MSNKWNNPNSDPWADIDEIARELCQNTGIKPTKKWEKMTPEERKIAVAEFFHNYAQQMYLMGYNSSQVVATLKELRKIMQNE